MILARLARGQEALPAVLLDDDKSTINDIGEIQLRVSQACSGMSFSLQFADRFGLWGVYGQPNVAWGNYARFVDDTAKLDWFLPPKSLDNRLRSR